MWKLERVQGVPGWGIMRERFYKGEFDWGLEPRPTESGEATWSGHLKGVSHEHSRKHDRCVPRTGTAVQRAFVSVLALPMTERRRIQMQIQIPKHTSPPLF